MAPDGSGLPVLSRVHVKHAYVKQKEVIFSPYEVLLKYGMHRSVDSGDQMSGSKRGLHEFRGSVNHSGQDTTYSTGLRSLLAKSCGQANLCVVAYTTSPNIATGLSQEENYRQLGHSGWPFWYSSVVLHLPDKEHCTVVLPKKHSEKH